MRRSREEANKEERTRRRKADDEVKQKEEERKEGSRRRGQQSEGEEVVKWKKYFTVTQLFSYPCCTTQILSPCLHLTPQSINTPPSTAP